MAIKIENLVINTNGNAPGISIQNIDRALIIKNGTVINTDTKVYYGPAIKVFNSKNITISDRLIVIIRSVYGIRLEDCDMGIA